MKIKIMAFKTLEIIKTYILPGTKTNCQPCHIYGSIQAIQGIQAEPIFSDLKEMEMFKHYFTSGGKR